MATEEPRPKDQTVRIQEPVKEPKPRPPPLDLSSGEYIRKASMAGTSSIGPKTPTSGTPRHDKEKKIGHRRVDDTGQVTYKKKPTSELMSAIQLGIGQSLGKLSSKAERDLLLCDFSVVESVFHPREGSNLTPAHHYSDFRFKTYAPIAFRYFRELFGIQPDDFLLSMCNEALNELSNPGASGSIFYITADDEFIIKTVQHKEAEFLQKLLPGYYMNLNQNPRTLLPKFYGLYCYQCGGKNIRFIVMNNLLPSSIRLHEKYDLKGSTYKRKASKRERAKKSPTLKDLDFLEIHPDGIMLEAETYTALIKTIERDCRVLQSFKIMDYSMLLGVHNLDLAIKERELENAGVGSSDQGDGSGAANAMDNSALSRGRSVRQRIAAYSTAMEAIQAQAEPVELENEDVPPGGIPARNTKGERLLLYIGIIDILQSYRLKKKLEHALKAAVHDGDTISVHRPGFFALRFQEFLAGKIFKKIPSLDQPQIKGPHMRFRKLVHLALKHSPSKKKSNAQRQRSITTTEIEEKEKHTERPRSQTTPSETGAIGGRPDLLPNTSTPPPHAPTPQSNEGGTYTTASHTSTHVTTHVTVSRLSSRSGDGRLEAGLTEGDGHGHGGLLGSPAHSISESTPTHTEYTEGTPSFTTSSPSCSSDMLDTPQSTRGSSSARRMHEVSTEQIHLEVINGSISMDTSTSSGTVVASADGSLSRGSSGDSRSPGDKDAGTTQDEKTAAQTLEDQVTRL